MSDIPTGWTKRFADKVKIGEKSECWPWTAVLIPGGYGQFWLDGKMRNSHRVALELSGVSIPDGHVVMHACDNRKCCNPEHLSVAKQVVNILDAHQKRRAPAGEKHGAARLKESDVIAIRNSPLSVLQLATQYGVSRAAIYDVLERRSWKNVTPA